MSRQPAALLIKKERLRIASVSDTDIFKNALEHARQLSTLRFAILTVFMTASGALFAAFYHPNDAYPRTPIALAGVWLSFVFLICEITLSYTMARQNDVAKGKIGKEHKSAFKHRHWLAVWPIRVCLSSIYVAVGFYWGMLLLAGLRQATP